MPSIRCARCGYDNHLHQRFCGMCGLALASPAGVSEQAATPVRNTEPQAVAVPVAVQETQVTPVAEKPVSFSSGPSFLGLAETSADADYLLEENPQRGRAGTFVVVLALALVILLAGWVLRNKPPGWLSSQFTQVKASIATMLGSKSASEPAPVARESTPPVTEPSQSAPQAQTAPPPAVSAAAPSQEEAMTDEKPEKPPTSAASVEKIPDNERASELTERAKSNSMVQDGEKYLYGRSVRQDCGRAKSALMAAADMSNPKAQGILGTMYATGHCVPRDLPTSYHWFIRAKQESPRDFRIDQDLRLVWKQMTLREQEAAGGAPR